MEPITGICKRLITVHGPEHPTDADVAAVAPPNPVSRPSFFRVPLGYALYPSAQVSGLETGNYGAACSYGTHQRGIPSPTCFESSAGMVRQRRALARGREPCVAQFSGSAAVRYRAARRQRWREVEPSPPGPRGSISRRYRARALPCASNDRERERESGLSLGFDRRARRASMACRATTAWAWWSRHAATGPAPAPPDPHQHPLHSSNPIQKDRFKSLQKGGT